MHTHMQQRLMQKGTGPECSFEQFIEYSAFSLYSKSVHSAAQLKQMEQQLFIKMKTWSVFFVLLYHHRREWISIPDAC